MKNSIDFEELKKLVEEVAQPIAPLPSSELSQLTALIAQCFTLVTERVDNIEHAIGQLTKAVEGVDRTLCRHTARVA